MRNKAILRAKGAVRKAIDAAVQGAINYSCNEERDKIIALAVRSQVNTLEFSRQLGVSRQAVYNMRARGERLLEAEGETGKACAVPNDGQ